LAGVPVVELLLSPLLDEDVLPPLPLDVLPLPASELAPSPPPPPQACNKKSADAERARSVLFMEVARIEKMDKQNTTALPRNTQTQTADPVEKRVYLLFCLYTIFWNGASDGCTTTL